jgi:hypothetical protein
MTEVVKDPTLTVAEAEAAFVQQFDSDEPSEEPTGVEGSPDADTETETVIPEGAQPEGTDTETETEPGLDALMTELNLTGQYKTPQDALKAVAHQRREIEARGRDLNAQTQELQELRDIVKQIVKAQGQPTAEPQTQLSDDQLADMLSTNPRQAFARMAAEAGYVRKNDIAPLEERLDTASKQQQVDRTVALVAQYDGLKPVADYIEQHGAFPPQGFNAKLDEMRAVWAEFPGVASNSVAEALKLGARLTATTVKKPTVPQVSESRKRAATTTTTSTRTLSPGGGAVYPPDFDTWPVEKMREFMARHKVLRFD